VFVCVCVCVCEREREREEGVREGGLKADAKNLLVHHRSNKPLHMDVPICSQENQDICKPERENRN